MRLLAWFAAATLSQSPPAPPQQPADTFKAGVELVRLDVRVSGVDGRPITDLRQDEIEVVDGGERLPVVLFQHVAEPEDSFADVASRTVGGEVSTNHGAARGHLYVIIFDQLHISPGNEQRARQAAQRFVTTRLRPGDRVALYALPGPGPQIPFTADARRVSQALRDIHGTAELASFGAVGSMTRREAFEIIRGNELVLQRVAARVQSEAGSDAQTRGSTGFSTGTLPLTELVKEDARKIANAADGETRAVLARFADVLRPLRAIEGRKNILLISEGFQGDRLSREIDTVAAAAAESASVIHAFDINRREIDITANEPVGGDQAGDIHDKISPLGSLAAETGGSLVLDVAARADRAFASIAEQSQDYYLIGFTPAARALDRRGEYQRVSVHVKRPGARVQTRTGFALGDKTARMDRQQAIQRAMAAPFPLQGLPIRYTTYTLRGSAAGTQTVILSLDVDLPLASVQEHHAADVAFIVRSVEDGRVAASGRDVIGLPAQRGSQSTSGTGNYRVQFDLPPGDYMMRTAVREPGGLIGTADRRFTVRALDGPAIESGDLMLSAARGELPVRPSAYTGDGLTGVLELYGRTAEQLESARVVIELVPIGESSAVVSGSAELRDVRPRGRGVGREARLELPLQSVAPGAYLARARIMVGSDTVSQVVREVDVKSGQRPERPSDGPEAASFDPREIAASDVARDFASHLDATPVAADARRALERLAAADYPAAIAGFETILRSQPDNAVAAFLQGWAYHGAGQDRLAISAWRRAAYIDQAFVPAHLALADLFTRIAQPELALQAVRAGLVALPQSPELLDRLSRLERR
jgi:VWFA-related protein